MEKNKFSINEISLFLPEFSLVLSELTSNKSACSFYDDWGGDLPPTPSNFNTF